MTVCRRPVASHVPRGAGNRGLLWVGTHRNPGKVPPPTLSGTRKPWSEAPGMAGTGAREVPDRVVPAYELGEGVGVVPPTPVFRVVAAAGAEVAEIAIPAVPMSITRRRDRPR
jgi:hypothetical protein